MDLFDRIIKNAPLAEKLRPVSIEDFVGQDHLLGSDKILKHFLESKTLFSLILWGPPGVGKTTLAHLLAKAADSHIVSMSAVTGNVKDLKEIMPEAKNQLQLYRKKTILFIDEIHRFNKAQQDYLLPFVEQGIVTLIGATTENPSFEVISPLLSRCKVLVLHRLSAENIKTIVQKALVYVELAMTEKALFFLTESANGDARAALNSLEIANHMCKQLKLTEISLAMVEEALQRKNLYHDKKGEEHYNTISAFIKSMRGSDPDAAVYWMVRMLEAGEDPLFIARRMVIFASEDIGNSNPLALSVAVATMQAVDFVGLPEAKIPLAQAATYLASAPKSNASYVALQKATEDVKTYGNLDIPLYLRNAPTQLMKNFGYGKGYQYAHDQKDKKVSHPHLPEKLQGKKYYTP